jgi:phage/plasmid-associated DNA primase
LPIFQGDGGNGKSILVDAVMAALGDYADARGTGWRGCKAV